MSRRLNMQQKRIEGLLLGVSLFSLICLFVFVALRTKSTANVMAGR